MYFIFFIFFLNATQLLNNMQGKHIQYVEISSLNCLLIRFVVYISMISEFDTVRFNFFLKNVKCD